MSARALVISGGPLHPFDATTAALVELAAAEGIAAEVPLDPTAALDRLAHDPWDVVVVNALLWSMPAERHAPLRDGWSWTLGDGQAQALADHVSGGGGLLACHSAPICFDGHPTWRGLLGATWDWDRSHHPPLGPARVRPTSAGREHPLTEGIEPFEVVDEVYGDLDLDPDVVPLLVAAADGGADQPVLWTHAVDRGRVVVDLLGHQRDAYDHPVHAAVVRRALRWLAHEEARR